MMVMVDFVMNVVSEGVDMRLMIQLQCSRFMNRMMFFVRIDKEVVMVYGEILGFVELILWIRFFMMVDSMVIGLMEMFLEVLNSQ